MPCNLPSHTGICLGTSPAQSLGQGKGHTAMIKLTWMPGQHAYSVSREGGRIIGLVRCLCPFPFRQVVEWAKTPRLGGPNENPAKRSPHNVTRTCASRARHL